MPSAVRPPVVFLSHGAPPLADDPTWTRELRAWGAALPRPTDVLVVSAHWESDPATLGASRLPVPLVHDFWGFPSHYYDVRYDAPTAPQLADEVEALLGAAGGPVARDEERGLDHGAYVPLVEMFPEADVPVLQLSLPSLDPSRLFELGRRLAPLRERGTLILGSGFTTHNLRMMNPDPAGAPSSPSTEFDHWAAEAVAAQDVDALLGFEHAAPAASLAHPRTEHWAPLLVVLGAADAGGSLESTSVVDGFWHGLSKRSWEFAA